MFNKKLKKARIFLWIFAPWIKRQQTGIVDFNKIKWKLSLFNKADFLEKENYECHKSKELLTYEVNNLKKELSYKKKVSPNKNKKIKKVVWSDSKSSKGKSSNLGENKSNQSDYLTFVASITSFSNESSNSDLNENMFLLLRIGVKNINLFLINASR